MKRFLLYILICLLFYESGFGEESISTIQEEIMGYNLKDSFIDISFGENSVNRENALSLGVKRDMLKSGESAFTLLYPKILVSENAVNIQDIKGNLVSRLDLLSKEPGKRWSRVSFSKNGKYIAINNIYEYDQKLEQVEKAEVLVLDDRGNSLWKMKHKLAHLKLSPNGKFIVGISSAEWKEAPLLLYDRNGLIKEIPKSSESYNVEFSDNNDYIVVALNDKNKSSVEVIDGNGSRLWTREFIGNVGSPGISKDGRKIAVGGSSYENRFLAVFDDNGNKLWEKDFSGTGPFIFSDDGKFLFAPSSLYNAETGEKVWSKEDLLGFPFVTPDFEYIMIVKPKWERTTKEKDLINILNNKGEIIWVKEFGANEILYGASDYKPQVNISSDGETIAVATKEGVRIFAIRAP